jgi:hypothetical protein
METDTFVQGQCIVQRTVSGVVHAGLYGVCPGRMRNTLCLCSMTNHSARSDVDKDP